jgi:lipoprotein-anchoring transpeptidase ErfK/SrfK
MRRIVIVGMALALGLALAAPAAADEPVVHVVQSGQNLFRIALRYGVTVDALVAANGLGNASHIYAGQRLVIPTQGSTANPTTSPSNVHVVQRGENLFRIALRYGMTHHALAAANGLANVDHVYAGQRLVIPGRGTAPAAPAPSAPSGQTDSGDTPPPSPPAAPAGEHSGRWIDVDLSAQRLTAYEGNTAARSTLVSTGLSRTPTPTGRYRVYIKYASTLMSGPGYYLPNVPYTMFFYRGYSIHGTYWHSNFGRPMSHGCINLPTSEAQWLYNWASVGTLVNIHN